ncbi:hypothetical protein RND81_14G053900 [Saponaria officinalis]|uniref:Protein kinase domain-containing protein n=1 Tax=Saponaria officinalis TaxID=3572 RepID=A0AAW1GLA8_SAPOF
MYVYSKLQGLELAGNLGEQLANLHSLKDLDVSLNSIEGELPSGLPPNVTHLNLSSNRFLLGIPHSISSLSRLRHLNLSHNLLSGPIGSVFNGLQNLKEMDLSYNKLAGDLPSSFAYLTNLSYLYLQSNELTGSVIYLADLQLTDLNIQNNHFSGIIPQHFQTIPNLWIGGNKFDTSSAPWNFPFEKMPNEQTFARPPTVASSAVEKNPSSVMKHPKHNKVAPGIVALLVGGIAVTVSLLAVAIAIRVKQTRNVAPEKDDSSNRSMYSIPVSSTGEPSPGRFDSIQPNLDASIPPSIMPRTTPFLHYTNEKTGRRSVSRNIKKPSNVKLFTAEELRSATNNFSQVTFLGEGSLGSVYKAQFPDGRIFAVKSINTESLSLHEEEQFLDVVHSTSRLRHPSIVNLIGYCLERGLHLLVYDYVRGLTLEQALYGGYFMPLTWTVRIRIAVGVAQALDYMHSLSPAMAHCNLKAANILLDDELMPHVCDVGLSVLRPLSRNSIKMKASEMAINDSGYIAPEHGEPTSTKSDVYAFGVILLELLTGKKPYDSSRPQEEQSLAAWASSRLHDDGSLKDMVDPILRRAITFKALSAYADVISLCLQPEKEFRATISDIIEVLIRLSKPILDGTESDIYERSFRSTHTRFLTSPAASFLSP